MIYVDGLRVEVADLPGEPGRRAMVLLHEGLGSIAAWRDFPERLADATRRRVVAYSRFGHGRSERPRQPRTPAFFHEEALDVLPVLLRELEAPAPILVGHSDGGSIALIHAARHDVSGLVLMAPHVVVEEITIETIRKTRDEFEHGELRARMARRHDDPDAAFHGWCDVWLDPAFRTWSIEEEAARVTAPMLLIQGADDAYGTLDQLDRIEARTQGRVHRLVLAGGHRLHRDAPDNVVEAIAGFAGPLA